MDCPGGIVAGRYRVESLIARGGMADVYRARHLDLGIDVALKLLAPDAAAGDRRGDRFEREARNAARLDHPACVRILDCGIAADGTRYLAMELLEGPSLRSEVDRGAACRIDTGAWVAGELLGALAHAHGRGLLHRDIKPENVVFAARGGIWQPVLVDFGLSQLRDDAPLTATGACVGSPSYIAPERLLGNPGDERADLYAVGVLLYELLCGQKPFHAEATVELAMQHVSAQAPPVRALRPDVPAALAAVVHRALAKDPGERFDSAAAMQAAIARAMAGSGVELVFTAATAASPQAALPVLPAQPSLPVPPVPRTLPAQLPLAAGSAGRRGGTVAAAIEGETSADSTCFELGAAQPALRRLLGWMRFGAWRWRLRAA